MRARAAALSAMLFAAPAWACEVAPWSGTAMPDTLVQINAADGPAAAWYDAPTTRYAHGVLGDTIEAGALVAQLAPAPNCQIARIDLPQDQVFEDLAPRLADLNGDGFAEIIVVQSSARLGAKLAIYGVTPDGLDLMLYGATPNIGRANRWLAPIGIADLDGDGAIEIAYIDRPHLARTLRVWRVAPAGLGLLDLREVALLEGLTNHRIGEDFISSGIRVCGTGPEMITANADWSRVMATQLSAEGDLLARALAPWSQDALALALDCQG